MATDLIARIAGGEAEAEKELIAKYSRGVNIILRRMLGRRAATGDAHADTFRQVFEKIRSREFEDPWKLDAFIAVLARFRGGASREAWQPAEQYYEVLREQNAGLVRELLSAYGSMEVRRVLFLYFVSGMDMDTIASKTGLKREKCSDIVAEVREEFSGLFANRARPDVDKL